MARVEHKPDHVKARSFFRRVLSLANDDSALILVVAHLVDSAIPFIPSLDEKYHVQVLLGKPSSIQTEASHYLAATLGPREHHLNKADFRRDPAEIVREAFPEVKSDVTPSVVILDIGGYFAQPAAGGIPGPVAIRDVLMERGYRLAGFVEDTQNGEHRYQEVLDSIEDPEFVVYSVAHSPLKRPENHLVGVAISFSVEAILRQSNIVLQSRRAGVIGFGPIGRSVAHSLRNRGIPVSICERDSIQLAQAAAQGFRVFNFDHHFEEFARDLNLIVSATGAGAKSDGIRPINPDTVSSIRSGTYIASVTSQDDEIDLGGILSKAGPSYRMVHLRYNSDVSKLTMSNGTLSPHSFYLLADGNAINFKHGGVIGPAIQLLQGEVLACVNQILSPEARPSREVQELPLRAREEVARMWLDHYLSDSSASLY